MPNIGLPEIILILVLALIVFGPTKLPEVGRSVGRGLREFRRASQDWRDELERGLDPEEPPSVDPRPVPRERARTDGGGTASPGGGDRSAQPGGASADQAP